MTVEQRLRQELTLTQAANSRKRYALKSMYSKLLASYAKVDKYYKWFFRLALTDVLYLLYLIGTHLQGRDYRRDGTKHAKTFFSPFLWPFPKL